MSGAHSQLKDVRHPADNERVTRTRAQNGSSLAQEGRDINTSLSALEKVCRQLASPNTKHVSYRDHKLTQALQVSSPDLVLPCDAERALVLLLFYGSAPGICTLCLRSASIVELATLQDDGGRHTVSLTLRQPVCLSMAASFSQRCSGQVVC